MSCQIIFKSKYTIQDFRRIKVLLLVHNHYDLLESDDLRLVLSGTDIYYAIINVNVCAVQWVCD